MTSSPPRLPRNLSCVASLCGVGGRAEEDGAREGRVRGMGGRDLDRRRARSMPPRVIGGRLGIWDRSRSPRTRRRVRFADALGLDLVKVRRYQESDVPHIPLYVTAQHQRDELSCPQGRLTPTFPAPLSSPGFSQRLSRQRVCLEGVRVDTLSVRGSVRVLALGLTSGTRETSRMSVRYTMDEWATYAEEVARRTGGSPDGRTHRFSFLLGVPARLPGRAMEFVLRYQEQTGGQYWDNNGGKNYRLEDVRPDVSPPPECGAGWVHFI
uniref:CBM21 domain-containing protein n=1 Tax=Callorhinchus milii TaxID=7868 RepID=A0A4W3JN46_CALMI